MIKKIFFTLFILFLGIVILPFYVIELSSKNKMYNNVNTIPKNKVGMVLGTSKRSKHGAMNLYFKYRVEAAVLLFNKGKIDYILVSGDNATMYYNEPKDFRKELIRKGIPRNKIFLDYAGFRTLDSVIRSKLVFGQNEITIISQDFHNRRAVFIAKENHINAIGFDAKDVDLSYGFKVYLREFLARTKVFVDIIFNVKPKFLGDKITIE